MPACDLTIQLDRATQRFYPGEKLKGKIHVRVSEECQCDALTIALQWRTHGKGTRDEGPDNLRLLLSNHSLRPGTHSYPFEFELPLAPTSHHGQIVNVDWFLNARADIPWAFDPKAEANILVVPRPPGHDASRKVEGDDQPPSIAHHMGKAPADVSELFTKNPKLALLICGAILVTAPIFLFSVGWQPIPIGFFLGFLVVILKKFLGPTLRNAAARRRIGNTRIVIEPDKARPGSTVRVAFHIQPDTTCTIQGLHASLVGQEIAIRGSGSSRQTHTHSIHKQRVAFLDTTRTLEAKKVFRFEGTLQLPANASPSFYGGSNSIAWSILAEVDIPNCPDFIENYSITVLAS